MVVATASKPRTRPGALSCTCVREIWGDMGRYGEQHLRAEYTRRQRAEDEIAPRTQGTVCEFERL